MPRRKRQRGKRGQGSVYWDAKNATWMASISLGSRDGRRITRKRRARDEDDAVRLLEGLRRARDAGVDPAKGTLGQYLRSWLETKRGTVRDSTWRSYEGHVRLHISPLLGGIPIVRLRPADVRRLIRDRLDAGRDPATVARIVTTLGIAMGQAVADRILLDDPTAGVRLPKVERDPVVPMTTDQADAIIAACRDSSIEHLVVLLLGSGVRLGEALGLDWRDVDLDHGYVVVRRSKTQVRAVPISDDAVDSLRAQMAATPRYGPAEPVFISQKRSRLTGQRERLRGDSALTILQNRLPEMTLHGLRHGVATMLVSQGVHMRVVAEQLGHRNPALTARVYAHVVPEAQRDAVKRLGRHRGTG